MFITTQVMRSPAATNQFLSLPMIVNLEVHKMHYYDSVAINRALIIRPILLSPP